MIVEIERDICLCTEFCHNYKRTLSPNFLWHARFGHINYDSLCLLKRKGVSGLPTIPRQLKQCDVCILGKHSKQPFYENTSKASRKLGLIHSNLCGAMLVPSANGNKNQCCTTRTQQRLGWHVTRRLGKNSAKDSSKTREIKNNLKYGKFWRKKEVNVISNPCL